MNKNEFYRNLMLTYTVDTEKVKRIAKRRVVKRSSKLLRIIPGAAACAAVTAAAVTLVSLGTFGNGRDGGVDIEGDAAAIARMAAAEQYYVSLPDDAELKMDMYVSFEQGMSYNEILLAFSKIDDDGEINIKLLYTQDGKRYENSDSISADGLLFLGAKISAPASMCKDIRLLNAVSLVELSESGITDDTFVPFGSSNLVTSTDPPADNSFEISLPSYTTTIEEITDIPETQETTTDTEPTETDPEITEETTETTPEEIPTDIDIPVAGVTNVNVISANRIVVTTGDSIRMYRLQEGILALETTFYVSNAKVSWKSYDGSSLYITACDSGARTRLYWADGKAGALTELDVSAITSDGAEITSVVATSDGSVTLFKTVTSEKSRIYAVRPVENALSINLVIEYDGPVTSLALIGNKLYYAYTDTKNATVGVAIRDLADGSVTDIDSYSGTLRSTRSQSFTSAALTFTTAEGEETTVLLTPDGTLVETQLTNISFSRTSGRIFTDGENYYYLNSDGAVPAESEAEAAAAFAPAPAVGDYVGVIMEDGSAYLMSVNSAQ